MNQPDYSIKRDEQGRLISRTLISSFAPTHYRGFSITFSDVNGAFNARPTADTLAGHPRLYPIAARTMAELTPCLDMMIEMYATKVISPAL